MISHNFFNSLRNPQNLISNDSKNSFINSFISDIKDYLSRMHSSNLLSTLRPYSLLTFAKKDGNFAVCFDYNEKKIYYVPEAKIIGNKPEPGEALKVNPNGTFHVDYTAIIAEIDKLDSYLKECKIAK